MSDMYRHQIDGCQFVLKNDGGFLWYAMGLGKTRIILESYKEWHARGYKLLVICPLSLIETAWREDISKFTPEFKMCNLHKKFIPDQDIYVTNYETMISKRRYAELCDIVRKYRLICVLDESSRISNFKSITTKNILALRHWFDMRVCLSGTPCSQSEFQWWPQITFLKSGILHDSPFAFKNMFFHLQRGKATMPLSGQTRDVYQSLFSKGWKLQITEHKRKLLMDRIRTVVLHRTWEDCEFELPPFTDEVRMVEMEPDQTKCYNQMKNHCITEIKDKAIVAPMALTKIMKLRQITSGFAITPEETIERLPVNPKLNELVDTLSDIGEQAVIFVNFRAEVADILSRIGDDCVVADGSVHDKTPAIEAFKSGAKKYLVANIQSLAHGVTLTNCRYMIYYSQTYSLEDTEQSRARIRRISQTKPQVYIHLLCENTIDQVIYKVLQKKGEAVEIIQEMMR